MRRELIPLLGLMAAALVAGCGGTSDSTKARSAVAGYLTAIADQEWGLACDRLTRRARRELFALALTDAPEKTLHTVKDAPGDWTSCNAVLIQTFASLPSSVVQQLRFAKVEVALSSHRLGFARVAPVDGPEWLRFGPAQIPRLVKEAGRWRIDSLGLDLPGGTTATIARERAAVGARAAARRRAEEVARARRVAGDLGDLYDAMVDNGSSREAAITAINREAVKAVGKSFTDRKARYALSVAILEFDRLILGQKSPIVRELRAKLGTLVPDLAR